MIEVNFFEQHTRKLVAAIMHHYHQTRLTLTLEDFQRAEQSQVIVTQCLVPPEFFTIDLREDEAPRPRRLEIYDTEDSPSVCIEIVTPNGGLEYTTLMHANEFKALVSCGWNPANMLTDDISTQRNHVWTSGYQRPPEG